MERITEITKGKISFNLLLVLCFLLPISTRVLSIIIVVIAVASFYEDGVKAKLNALKNDVPLLLLMALYLLYVLGLANTSNISFGLKDLETKLTLLIFPIIFSGNSSLNLDNLKKCLWALTYGCLLAMFICETRAIYNFAYEMYARNNNITLILYPYTNYFFSGYLSFFMHHSYFSMYLNLVISFLLLLVVNNRKEVKTEIILLILFSVFNFFVESKAGIVFMFLEYAIVAVWYFVNAKKIKSLWLIVCALAVGSFLFYKLYPNGKRIADKQYEVVFKKKVIDLSTTETSEVRVLVWNAATNIIKQNYLFGVGTGDVKDVLVEEYKKLNYTGAYNRKLNSHNQYFQTFIAGGIVLFALLVFSLLNALLIAIKQKELLAVLFFLNVILNMLVESMLEVSAGVIFISLFYCLFSIFLKTKEKI